MRIGLHMEKGIDRYETNGIICDPTEIIISIVQIVALNQEFPIL